MKKSIRAKKRIKELKGFYTHLTVFLLINAMITLIKIVGTQYYGDTFMGPIVHFSTFSPWFFWGLGLLFHAFKVFRLNTLFSKNWENRQIDKILAAHDKGDNITTE